MGTLPSYRTWVAGEILTAANMNSNVRDAGNFFLSVPVFEGRQTVAQSLGNNATTAITLDTEDIDTDNGHSTATNTSRYTAATSGRYQLSGGISFTANATGVRTVALLLNGTVINGSDVFALGTATDDMRLPARTLTAFMNGTTDFVEIGGFQNSGAGLNTVVAVGSKHPRFSVRWVGTT